MDETWGSIEEWAKFHGFTLDQALEVGVRQKDDDTIWIPDDLRRELGQMVDCPECGSENAWKRAGGLLVCWCDEEGTA